MEITRKEFDAWRYMLSTLDKLDVSKPKVALNIMITNDTPYDLYISEPIDYEDYRYTHTYHMEKK